MYIVHVHKARESEGGSMRERERGGGGGKREFKVSNTSGHSNIDHDLSKVILHSDRYRSPSASYTIRARFYHDKRIFTRR